MLISTLPFRKLKRDFSHPVSSVKIKAFVALLLLFAGSLSAQTTQTFNSSGTWLAPAGVTAVKVECWGGGGRGGSASFSGTETGGGGGGAYSRRNAQLVTPGTTYTVTVGTGSTSTSAGGDSWFSTSGTAMAKGGNSAGDASAGASGGSATSSVGDVKFAGGNGANGSNGNYGGGGGSSAGTGAAGVNATNQNGAVAPSGGGNGGNGRSGGNGNGFAGVTPGGGGGGVRAGLFGSGTGGAGANGQVILTYTCPNYALTSTSVSSSICTGSSATINLSGNVSNLPEGTYTVTYNLTGANTGTGLTVSMTVATAGSGSFATGTLNNSGSTTITITNLSSGAAGGVCSSNLSSNNTAVISVISVNAGSITGAQTLCSSGDPSLISNVTLGSGSGTITYLWQSSTTSASTGFSTIPGEVADSYDPPAGISTTTWFRRVTISDDGSNVCQANSAAVEVSVMTVNAGAISGNQTVCGSATPTTLGNTTAGSVTYTGTGTPVRTYRWEVSTTSSSTGFTTVGGATANTYSPSSISTTTWYRRVTIYTLNSVSCEATSNVVQLIHVTFSSSIDPAGTLSICPPGTSLLLTSVTDASSPTYQWKQGGSNISGATGATYTASGSGSYTVAVTSSGCTIESAATIVSFPNLPSVSASSTSSDVCEGSSTNLSANSNSNFSSTVSPNTPITDNNATGITSQINASGLPSSLSGWQVRVTVNIPTTYTGDIEIYLARPGGAFAAGSGNNQVGTITGESIRLSNDNGGSGDGYSNCTFRDDAATNITTQSGNVTITGSYIPEQLFSTLTGNPNGNWTLRVTDDAAQDVGTLASWTLQIIYPGGLSYSWTSSPAGFTSNLQNPTGVVVNETTTYTVTMTDVSSGCTQTADASVNIIAQPSPKIIPGDTVLCTNTDYWLHVVDTGAYSGGYPVGTTLDWVNIVSNQNPNDSINANGNGSNYQAVITLPQGCSATSPLRTVLSKAIIPSEVITHASCNLSNGKIVANVVLGTAPYRYLWKESGNIIRDTVSYSTADSIYNMSAATYTLELTDNYGNIVPSEPSCSTYPYTYTINQVAPPSVTVLGTNITCFGYNDGIVSAQPNQGTSPYSYIWSNGGTNPTLSYLAPGTYTVTVTDGDGCTAEGQTTIIEPGQLVANLAYAEPLCFGDSNAIIHVSVGGGTPPFSYEWYDPNLFVIGTNDDSLVNIPSGLYSIYLSDQNSCNVISQILVEDPPLLTISASATGTTCFGGNDGTLNALSAGGRGIHSYLWSNGNTSSSQSGVVAGVYTVTVTDINGCTAEATTTVTQPDAVSVSATGADVACIDGTTSVTVVASGGTAPYTGEGTFTVGVGTHNYSITDANGCAGSGSVTINHLDNQAPVISGCPGDITQCGDVATWTAPSAIDNCTLVSFVSDHNPGESFPVGTTLVTYTATDNAGLVSTCTFNVTILPTPIWYADADGDLFGNPAISLDACTQPVGYVSDNSDCDDAQILYSDNDGDTFGAGGPAACGVTNNNDCDDNNAAVNPSATEVCNSIDDDCDGSVDEGVLLTFYADADGDLYGDAAVSTLACSAPVGYVADNTDCNDAVASINPAAAEVCNGIDDNCDGLNDNGLTFADYYADADGDLFGGAFLGNLCAQPSGSVLVSGDCDDNNAAVNPSATEVCNSIDDDCDGSIDEGVLLTFYADADGDGFGDAAVTTLACAAPVGYVADNTDCNDAQLQYADNDGDTFGAGSPVACGVASNTDCDDNNAAVNPSATEVCNSIDDDCDGSVDEGVLLTFYADADGDLYGDAAVSTLACSAPVGYVADNTDCNDAVASINPAAAEVCNGIDDNCDGLNDNGLSFADYYADADGDLFGGAFLGNLCAQPSGSVLVSGDCDDNNAAVNPSATEVCNSIDDDCDGSIDEGVLLTFYADADGDGFGDAAVTTLACAAPVGYVADNTDCNDAQLQYADNDGDTFGAGSPVACGVASNTDCDDNNAAVNPSATEVCNSIDDDCDGSVDEGVLLTFYADADGDLYGDAAVSTLACSAPVGYVADNTDCNDAVASINPAAAEVCNGIDDNCDGLNDNGLSFADYYADADGDLFGGAFLGNLCAQPSGSVLVSGDCDDNNAAVNPSATEVCNSIDDDCDGSIDEGVLLTFYADADGDLYGDAAVSTLACSAPVGYVADNTDCNDAVASINPAAAEVCNGIDDNCDGLNDNGLSFADYYADADGDLFGGAFLGNLCAQPSGSVLASGDCDDNNAAVNPSATEVCNSIDDDCDGSIDEGVLLTFYADVDGDGFGDAAVSILACAAPVGYVADNTDCNDAQLQYTDNDGDTFGAGSPVACGVASNTDCDDNSNTVYPGASEICGNGIDEDCDGNVDNGCPLYTYFEDEDGDSYGNPNEFIVVTATSAPFGYVVNNLDCDDDDAAINPAATEVCNSIDDDCDGSIDEGVLLTFYADADGDLFGDAAVSTLACSAPVGYVADNTDCNDAVASINPAAAEVCNGIDDNCDGLNDNGLSFADYYADADGDLFGGAFLGNLCAQPSGSVLVSGDCDDNNASVNPSATEVCNSIDDDCDGSVDEGVLLTFYADADGDLYGDAAVSTLACSAPVGYVADNTDCNDAVASINPAAAEVCNGIDDNCDGLNDNGLSFADYYADADGDLFGGAFLGNLCAQPSGSVLVSGDCDDNNAAVNPSATEVCNSIDDDCDGSIDEGVLLTFYADADGDLYGDAAVSTLACSAPVGYVADNTDCNDAVASINPAAAEVCNGIDDNCDGLNDNGLSFADFYADADGDLFGGAFLGNLCAQPSGSVLVSGDCDDNNAAVNPAATEVCNSIDDDCDGSIDEGVLLTFYADVDGDGFGDAAVTTLACAAPVGYVADNTDCNDAVASINPAAAEVCNGIDDNCDGLNDNGLSFADFYADADGDLFGGAFLGNLCAQPSGSVLVSGDCDDNNAAVNPAATEVCNSIDDDCDGSIDEGVLLTFYADADGDGFGDAAVTTLACAAPVGYVADNTDCNDAQLQYADNDGDTFGAGSPVACGVASNTDCDDNNAAVNPSATEVCNSIDDDCDGSVDEGVLLTFYADADGDLYGDAAVSTLACSAPVGYVADNTDCNDAVASINPAAAEVCNGIDDNCDGLNDNGLSFADYYADADGDLFGGAFLGNLCAQPSGSVLVSGDCDDNNAAVNPSATEVCNSIDDDCDGSIDEGVLLTFYADADGDLFGDAAVSVQACSAPVGYVADNTDCNDAVASINPAAAEVCNGIDDNCDGLNDNGLSFADYYADADGDLFGGAFLGNLCAQPSGSVLVSGDCDDNNAAVNPSATEVCNSIDDDCDGSVDEGVLLTFYADADGDLFGDAAVSVQACSAPVGYVADNTDCNDAVASINPAAAEVCNGIDDNCDGLNDNGLSFADFYADADGDLFGGAFLGNLCAQPSGSVLVSGDCDDNNAAVNPAATEVCNSIDDDCDGSIDEGVLLTFYADADGDLYGDAAVSTLACSAPVGYVADNTDCNDAVASINPAAAEVCNGIDDNCDGLNDNGLSFADFYADADGDLFGGAFLGNLCAQPSGSVLVSGDCDDNNAAVNPAATEVCNSIDDDCDGSIDEGVLLTFYADADGDLYGDAASTTLACSAPVGYVADNTDCNDAVASINPAAAEVCNGIDDNCDGLNDNGLSFADYYADADGDLFGGAFLGNLCAQPSGSVLVSGDCDDNNAAVNPSAVEVCNSIDDDCDGSIDEGVLLTFYADADGDLYGDAASTTLACSAPVGYVADNTDCNDAVASINPAAAEVCNGIDDNCDGLNDNGLSFADYYADADGDLFGGAFLGNLCAQPSGSVLVSGDCDDNNAAVNPSAVEVCNSIDDDCDGSVDEGVLLTFYADADGDLYGDAAVSTLACSAPVGYVADNTDCNDAVASINPAAAEVCNGIDDNCDGLNDNGLTFADYYTDADGDLFGGAFLGNLCAQPSGSVLVSGDCDDNNAAVNPSAVEVCNSIDDDCDGSIDEGVLLTFYADADGDLYGDAAVSTLACSAPVGYVADNTDCNDAVASINPAAAEVCNGIDDNCDGLNDNGLSFADYYADADGDLFGGAFLGNLCAQPSGSVLISGDCDDNNAAVNPSAVEVCNSIDDDCDGSIDEGVLLTFYADADGDLYGDAAVSTLACSAPVGYVADNTDCNDAVASINPAAAEVCNGIDDNCDGLNDNGLSFADYYADADGDLFGGAFLGNLCAQPSGSVLVSGDCDDNNASVNPSATEVCNSIDDDCDGSVDEGVLLTFYADADGDLYGDAAVSTLACSAPVGYVADNTDCNDAVASINPAAAEVCNGIDDNCDGLNDNGLSFADYYADADGDLFGGAFLGNLCAQPSGSVLVSGDCDDNNAAVNPSATEVCNSIDDDCDGSIDEGVLLTFYADADGDLFGDAAVSVQACSAPVGYVADNTDCNDAVASINPAAAEVCNGIDDNCDGLNDNGLSFADYYADADGDLFGGAFLGNLCAQPSGSVLVSGDCDDNNAAVNPSATEVCNSIDDDCDGSVDEGVLLTFYADADGDLFGDAAVSVQACSAPVGYVADNTDCNDAVASINPAAAEVCNGIDDNCDGLNDNGLSFADFYADADGDLFGGAFLGNLCAQPSGSVLVSGDCDDNNAAVNPSATEVCNSIDDDCDGSIDEGVLLTFYADADGDLYGDAAVSTLACSAPVGYVADNTDCNDAVASINPAAAEVCNGIDDNCDGLNDNGLSFADYYADADGDLFGGAFLGNLCAQPSGSVLVSGDCDDNNAAVNPSATEVCNSIDDDCDGSIDEGVLLTFYADADGDLYGDAAVSTLACSAPVGYVADNTDCNDAVASINPAAAEVCNGIDDNCDGLNDNGLSFADYYADADGDLFGGAFLGNLCAQPSGSVLVSGDCDDNNASVNPSATEVCNSIDDDCDGSVDEGVLLTFYADADGDLYGDAAVSTLACSAPVGYVADNTDCNDAVASINPAAAEVCNGIDDNCDGLNDNGLSFADYYADADGDLFGGAFLGNLCAQPSGSVLVSGDCDDNNAAVNPSATEVCNSIDDDCDGSIDEGVLLTFYADADGDLFGDAAVSTLACSAPVGYVADNTDCNDAVASINPAAAEVCNGIDDNCDGLNDNGLSFADYYADADGDLFGGAFLGNLCAQPSGSVLVSGDCDDNNAAVNPAATEVCNSIDDDCDGSIDEGVLLTFYADADGDLFGDAAVSVQACSAPVGYVAAYGDCDDTNNAIHPGAVELCNGIDDDCDGIADDNVFIPLGAINGPAQQCVPATFNFATFSITPPAGANFYHWVVPSGMSIYAGQGTNSVLVTWTGQSVHNGITGQMSVTVSTTCGGTATSTVEVDINYTSPVQPPSISGPGKVCPGDAVTYSVAAVSRAKSYTWTVPAGMTITSGQGTNIITASINGAYTGGSISVYASNFCGNGASRTKSLSVNTALAPAVITGQVSGLCGASNTILTTAGSPSATAYLWSVPTGVTIQSGQGSNTVSLDISNSFTSGTVTVTSQNGCGNGASRTLTISGTPGQASPIAGPTTICSGTAGVLYEVSTVSGATSYTWTVPGAIGTIAAGQGTKNISVNFNTVTASNQAITVRASNACGQGPIRSLNGISVSPANCGSPRTAESGISKVEVFPNPATSLVNVRFESESEQAYELRVIDLSGRVVLTMTGEATSGSNQKEIALDQFASGVYYVTLSSGSFNQQIRLMVE